MTPLRRNPKPEGRRPEGNPKAEIRNPKDLSNRFNGFSRAVETVETVSNALRTPNTPLKRRVNEKWWRRSFSRYEISGLEHSFGPLNAGWDGPAPHPYPPDFVKNVPTFLLTTFPARCKYNVTTLHGRTIYN
jgi:hypothetical protein